MNKAAHTNAPATICASVEWRNIRWESDIISGGGVVGVGVGMEGGSDVVDILSDFFTILFD